MAEMHGTACCYVLVRTDLPVPDQMVQAAHACLEAGRQFQPAAGCHLAVLAVHSEAELLATAARASQAGIRCAVFYEPDGGLGYTAACTEMVVGLRRRTFRRFSLWKAEPEVIGASRAVPAEATA